MKAVFAAFLLCAGAATASAQLIRVAQESSAGAGDFNDNVLGYITAFSTTGTAADYYQYASQRYNQTTPAAVVDVSQIFIVNASDGLAFFMVHDAPGGGGGTAKTLIQIFNDNVLRVVSDDPGEVSPNFGAIFMGDHEWENNRTDGMALSALNNNWAVVVQFDAYTGLKSWQATSADGDPVDLNFDLGRRVQLRLARDTTLPVPEPATIALISGLGLAGLLALRRRA